MQRIEITQDFQQPVERVYAFMAEHENLGPIYGATITRLRDGDATRNGAGSVRALKVGPLPAFQETITEAIPDQLIAYRISQGSPLRGHTGRMQFTALGAGSRLVYVIEFSAVVPGLDRLIKVGLERTVRQGLKTVDARA